MSDDWCEVVTRADEWLLPHGRQPVIHLLVRALLAVEWVPMTMLAYPSIRACAKCTEMRGLGHKPTCSTDAALTAAGFPDQASRDEARKRMAEK